MINIKHGGQAFAWSNQVYRIPTFTVPVKYKNPKLARKLAALQTAKQEKNHGIFGN